MMILQAINSDGIAEPNLTIYPDSLPTVTPLPYLTNDFDEAHYGDKRLMANTILLSDIEVNGKRRATYNGVPSTYSVTASDISAMKAGSVEQVLRSMPGISIIGDRVDYRGGNVTMLIYDQGTVSALNPDETYSAVDRWTPPTPVQDWVIARNHSANTNALGVYIPRASGRAEPET
ncbi:MAG: hypothetical protein K2M29_02060 [Paramuribaculum sp.]|nr:hypothetical protein [Paramuribaculum sp.]